MLTNRVTPCLRPWLHLAKTKPLWRAQYRLASSVPSTSQSAQSTTAAPLASLAKDLDRIAPRIDIEASQIQIIESPGEFYSTLKAKILAAEKKIYISTLYIGKSEHELIATLRDALTKTKSLKISILTDALRGTRESPRTSCASLLAPLVRDFPGRVEVRMYHTPNLTGIRKVLIPARINEGWGLQHIKLYGIDDELILSGANLSSDYFTNRQDRYHLFSSRRVTDYFERIHNTLCSISCLLRPSTNPSGHSLIWPESNNAPDPLMAPQHYIAAATALLTPLTAPSQTTPSTPQTNTSIYPLISHPPTINTELPALTTLLSPSKQISRYTFTAGYFNPHPLVTSTLLALSSPPLSAPGTILTASPQANGFFGSKGISGMLPAAYSRLSLLFLQAARGKKVQLREWQRGVVGQPDGWTYHAKGLWVTLPTASESRPEMKGKVDGGPNVTLIGSSNYTTRSYGLDLEVGAMVVTRDPELREKWKREEEMLGRYTKPVTEEQLAAKDRRASWRVRLSMWIVRKVGGAL